MAENTPEEIAVADKLVALFVKNRTKLDALLVGVRSMIEAEIVDGGRLSGFIHSTKGRLKDEGHLHTKILRKMSEKRAKGEIYEITEENFFDRVTDLAAYRIMHLHPRQMETIHPVLLELFSEHKFPLFEPPAARVWDMETEKFYKDVVKLQTIHTTEKLYSSVHYVLRSNRTSIFTCEIQVRTLADEVWGEVDHTLNYPVKSQSVACCEQIKSLAHLTTSCNRLTDSIFASHQEWLRNENEKTAANLRNADKTEHGEGLSPD